MNKNILAIMCLLVLASCGGRTGPDESMVILSSDGLLLPPEYELLAPENVVYAGKDEKNVEDKSKQILLGSPVVARTKSSNEEVNNWLVSKAGGDKRIKNIREVLEEDLEKEEAENE